MMSLRDGLQRARTMDCDQVTLTACIWAPSLSQSARARTPAEQIARSGVLSEAFGAGVMLRELLLAALSA